MADSGKVAATTAASFGTAGTGGIIIWIFSCIKAHEIQVPTPETAMLMAAYAAPVFHGVMLLFERWFKVDLNDDGQIAAAIVEATPPQPIPTTEGKPA